MPFYKYRTDLGNTVTAKSVSSFSGLHGNEAQISSTIDTPSNQQLFLYKVSGGLLVENDDTTIVTYTTATGTALNGSPTMAQFTGYTGTTAPATFLSKTSFNSYTGTSAGITTASNGIRKNGTNVRLGGSLTGNTNIGLGSFNLIFTGSTGTLRYGSDLSASYNVRSLVDRGYVTGITSTLVTQAKINTYTGTTAPNQFAAKSAFLLFTGTTAPLTYQSKSSIVTLTGTTLPNTYANKAAFLFYTGTTAPGQFANKTTFNSYTGTTISTASNGLRQNGTNVRLGGSLSGNTNIGLGTFNLIFTGSSGTLRYGSDLSASYDVRSLVDRGYVTGITSTLIASANNGLTENGVNVRLGGTLTGGTTITSPATGSRLTFAGFPVQYGSDVSANYNVRSLVDKGYITGTTQAAITWKNKTTTMNTPPVVFTTVNISSGATMIDRGSGVLEVKIVYGSEVFTSGRTTTGTATTSFADYLAKGFVLAGGTYKIEYAVKMINSSAGNVGSQLLIDGVSMESGTMSGLYGAGSAGRGFTISTFGIRTLTAGSHSFRLQIITSNGTVTADYGQILITRIS